MNFDFQARTSGILMHLTSLPGPHGCDDLGPDARTGRWAKSPGHRLFAAVERRLGRRPMIAEDLGHVTPADVRLRDAFGLAPMRIFQFGFGAEADSAEHLPQNDSPLTAAYTGNHDTDTIVGWIRHLRPDERRRVLTYTGGATAAPQAGALRVLMASSARMVIFPMQDVLGRDKPAASFAAVRYRDHWFWVEDGDRQTKRALTVVMFIFTLADTGSPERLPLITIPAQ